MLEMKMPIKPKNRPRYPANWQEIRAAILARAGYKCEQCRVDDGARIARGVGPFAGTFQLTDGEVYDEHTGEYIADVRPDNYLSKNTVTIVLAIAHLDHQPENCDPENLRAWCQMHHLQYDAAHHAESARETRRVGLNNLELFAERPLISNEIAFAGSTSHEPMKDHHQRELVNQLRGIAVEFHATGQLRARISELVGEFINRHRIPADAARPDICTDRECWYFDKSIPAHCKECNPDRLPAEVESDAVRDVLAERRRQVEVERWTPEDDDECHESELAFAAGCYAMSGDGPYGESPIAWPWIEQWWKPTDNRRNLVKAGALILAEIERLDRATGQKDGKA